MYSLNIIFIERNSSSLIYESIKALEFRTSIVFKLAVPYNTILSCFFLFFFIIDLNFLIPAVIVQIFIPTAELVIPTGTETNKANTEIETQPVIVETKISKCFYTSHSLNHNVLLLLKDNFLFHQFFLI